MGIFAALPSDPKACALELARRGLPVFPCKPARFGGDAKRPYTRHGFKDATTDPAKIAHWFNMWPDALIGIPTGPVSGLMLLDWDTKHCDVDNEFEEMQALYGPIMGPLIRTMSSGLHAWAKWAPGIANSASGLRRGFDVRGEGGYGIAPGSTGYVLERDGDPAEPPAALVAAIRAAAGASPKLSLVGGTDAGLTPVYQRTVAEQVQAALNEGSRHDAVVRLVWIYVQRGFSLDEIMAHADVFSRGNGWSIPEGRREFRKAAESAFKKQGAPPAGKVEPAAIKILSLGELQSRAPPEWQITDTIPEGALSVLYGDSATFKTFVTLDMALSVAYGVPWQGKPTKQGVVIYVLGEGQGGFANRVRAWRQAHGLLDVDAPFYTILQPVPFGDGKAVSALIAAIEATGLRPALVPIDTLARNFGGGDPDKTQDMTLFVAGLDALRMRFSAGVLVVHHAGKDAAKGARNSSVLRAAADVEVRAEREEGAQRVKLTNTKQKDADEFAPCWIAVDPVEVTDPRTGEVVKSLAVRTDSATTAGAEMTTKASGKVEVWVTQTLRDAGTLTMSEILSRGRHFDRSNLHRTIRALISKNVVKRDDGPPVVIWLSDQYQGDGE